MCLPAFERHSISTPRYERSPGDELQLRIERDGEEIDVEVVLTGDEQVESVLPDRGQYGQEHGADALDRKK